MIDIFDDRNSISNGFFHYILWIIPLLNVCTIFVTLFMMDFGFNVTEAQKQISAICFGIGMGFVLYRIFVIAYNDIKNCKVE